MWTITKGKPVGELDEATLTLKTASAPLKDLFDTWQEEGVPLRFGSSKGGRFTDGEKVVPLKANEEVLGAIYFRLFDLGYDIDTHDDVDKQHFDPWIAVDFDGTLAEHTEDDSLGRPIPEMIAQVQDWLKEGQNVKIFTARVADDPGGETKRAIELWTKEHLGQQLEVTCTKDPGMTALYDDKAHGVVADTGIISKEDDVIKGWVTINGHHVLIGDPEAGRRGLAPIPRNEWPEHIKALVIPPAWKNVLVSPDPGNHLQAIGTDAKGREQYVYSKQFQDSQQAAKFERIKELEKELGKIKAQNDHNMNSGDAEKHEHAAVMSLIMRTGIRPGSETDTGADKKAFGATTLLGQHVVKQSDGTFLKFVGKKGVSLTIAVEDKGLASMLQTRAAAAGPNGQLFPKVSNSSLLSYVHSLGSGEYKTKDFRTLLATTMASTIVGSMKAPTTKKEYVKAVKAVATKVSERLGNTPTVALQSYIHPATFAPWNKHI